MSMVGITGALVVSGALIFAAVGKFAEGMSDADGRTMGVWFYLGCATCAALGGLLIWSGLK
jgi:hypothetical protein